MDGNQVKTAHPQEAPSSNPTPIQIQQSAAMQSAVPPISVPVTPVASGAGPIDGQSEQKPSRQMFMAELKYKQKCKDLRKRIREIENHNEIVTISISRTKRAIQRIRLERALLLEKLEEKTMLKVDDSDGTPSPPPSPVLPSAEYTMFCEQEKDKIEVGENEDLDHALAIKWKALSKDERDKYGDLIPQGKGASAAQKDQSQSSKEAEAHADSTKEEEDHPVPKVNALKIEKLTDDPRSDASELSDFDQSDMPPPSSEF